MSQYADYLQFAHSLADAARQVTLGYFRTHVAVQNKADASPVTIADKTAEQRLREQIAAHFPTHSIIGEEHENTVGDSEYEWIIDPIDGTRSFISGYPLYGTLIALLKNGEPIVSIIDMPALNERFFATADMPTQCRDAQNTRQIHSRDTQNLADAMLFSTDYGMFNNTENQRLNPLRQAVAMVRYNGDCYLYAMLAAGWIDVVAEADLKVYDFMPLKLIVEQAGGVISDWQGRALTKDSSGQVLAAANVALHRLALQKILTE